jgi:hypothetical protein
MSDVYSVSVWIDNTIHDTLRAIAQGVHSDLKELVSALDELSRALSAAANAGIEAVQRQLSSLSLASNSDADTLRGRHNRASATAKRLQAATSTWITDVGHAVGQVSRRLVDNAKEHVQNRALTAKGKARAIRRANKYARRLQRATRRAERNAKRIENIVGKALARVL